VLPRRKLDLDYNPLIVLDFDFNTTVSYDMTNLVLPEDLKCIPSEDLRDWVGTLGYGGYGGYPNDCRWFQYKCNDDEGPDFSEDGVPTNTAECCIWAGSYAGAPLNRTGTCSLNDGHNIDLSDRHITAIPPGAFDDCGSPGNLYLNGNAITSLAGVTFPASLGNLQLHDNAITSLAGVIFPASLS